MRSLIIKSKNPNPMKPKKDSPGVYPPPPLFYVGIFFISILLKRYLSIPRDFFEGNLSLYLAPLFIGLGVISVLPALMAFFKLKKHTGNYSSRKVPANKRNLFNFA